MLGNAQCLAATSSFPHLSACCELPPRHPHSARNGYRDQHGESGTWSGKPRYFLPAEEGSSPLPALRVHAHRTFMGGVCQQRLPLSLCRDPAAARGLLHLEQPALSPCGRPSLRGAWARSALADPPPRPVLAATRLRTGDAQRCGDAAGRHPAASARGSDAGSPRPRANTARPIRFHTVTLRPLRKAK